MLLTFSGGILATEPENNLFAALKRYAQLADASYADEAEMRRVSTTQGYSLSKYGHIPGLELTYALLTNETRKRQIISVRGTANIENALVDLSIKLVPDKHTGISLHQGFAQSATSIYQSIRPSLKKGYRISTTGHSLGGATALILAMYLDKDQYQLDRVITFGQPKVTNITGSRQYQHLNVTRVVTPRDLVPLVPPLDPMDLTNLDIYWHLGKEVILLSDSDYSLIDGLDSMLRATKIFGKALDEENLQHHKMSLYLKLIDSKTADATLVSYDNDFNIFGLFGS